LDQNRPALRRSPGPPLTADGAQEAEALGKFLRDAGVHVVYASPLDRTLRTAEIASAAMGVDCEVREEIAEWRRGETEAEVLARFLPLAQTALQAVQNGASIAMITHGGPIRLLLEHFGLAQDEVTFYRRQFDRDNPVPPAGVWRVAQRRNGSIARPELVFAPNGFTVFVPETVHV